MACSPGIPSHFYGAEVSVSVARSAVVSDGASGPFGCVTPESVVVVTRDQRAGMSTVTSIVDVTAASAGGVENTAALRATPRVKEKPMAARRWALRGCRAGRG